MVKGFVVNKSGKSRHIFQRTVFPGGKIELTEVYKLVSATVTEDTFETWLNGKLPKGWVLELAEAEEITSDVSGGRQYKETLLAQPVVTDTEQQFQQTPVVASDDAPVEIVKEVKQETSKEFITPRHIRKMTAKDIFDLKLKDNPKRILSNITSIHKLRRALALCKTDNRKTVLIRLIQGRIRQLNITL